MKLARLLWDTLYIHMAIAIEFHLWSILEMTECLIFTYNLAIQIGLNLWSIMEMTNVLMYICLFTYHCNLASKLD